MNDGALTQKTRWGVYLFLPAATVALGAMLFPLWLPPDRNAVFYQRIVPWMGIAASAAAFFAGHFSYPRVHSFKVFLAGYLGGLGGLAWFLLIDPPWSFAVAPRGLTTALLIVVFVNILAAHWVPSMLRYQLTKLLTLWAVGLEAVVVAMLRFVPGTLEWTRHLGYRHFLDPAFWIGPAWLSAIIATGLWRLRDEFHLGGVLAGASCSYFLAWAAPAFLADCSAAQTLLCAAAPLTLNIGMVIHWFLRIEHRVSYDPLLHIYNRNYCSRIISEQSKLNTMPPFAVAMVDIDHFKQVNDTHGHQAGDSVLVNTAQAICRCVGSHGVVCRYGGEEMAVFFPQCTTKDVLALLEKVREEVEKITTVARNKKIKVTVSIGVAHRVERTQTVMEVIHAADKALYRAKEAGRNQVRAGKTPTPGARKKGREKQEE